MHFLQNVAAATFGLALIFQQSNAVDWTGNWAFSCDFEGQDLSNALTSAEHCSQTCLAKRGCTHYTWTVYNGGTCWMKSGKVAKEDAVDTFDSSMICGVVKAISGSTGMSGGHDSSSVDNGNSSPVLGVNYDAAHNPEYPLHGGSADGLPSAMDRDFQQIAEHFSYARTFYSAFFGFPIAPHAAKYGVKLYLGVFMTDESWYQSQVDNAVDAVRNYPDTIEAILVGNENLSPNGPYSADQIIQRIQGIKNAVRQATGRNVPVGTVQRITEWTNDNIRNEASKLADAADIIGVNIYPFFGRYDPNRPTDSLNAQWNTMVNRYDASKLRLTETGHATAGGNSPSGVAASLDAATNYYHAFKDWKAEQENGPRFWFAFYDRRPDDNSVPGEIEKHFGIFNWDRSQKSAQYP